jgi:hypothetical protein
MKNEGKPLFHIDVHGKLDTKKDYDLDLGISCMHNHWWSDYQERDFIVAFENYLVNGFNKVLKDQSYKGFKAKCNKEPYLNGNWGDVDIATMNEQAIVLGIPSI